MIIRITFKDLDSIATQTTIQEFHDIPSGTCLSSWNSHDLTAPNPNSVGFWYLDPIVLNSKNHGGIQHALNGLLKYSGVQSVDILPFKENIDIRTLSAEEFYNMRYVELLKYINP